MSASKAENPLPFLLVLLACFSAPVQAQTVDTSVQEIARGYDYLNELRMRADMITFSTNAELEAAAQNHSEYLASNLKSGHGEQADLPGFTGSSPSERVVFAGYHAQPGENVSTGSSRVEDSIDGLMGAIYHRFGFLTFDHNEMGIGIAASSGRGFYTYNSGNGLVNDLCSSTSSASSGFTNVCASNPSKIISANDLNNAEAQIQGNNPGIVVWPVPGESDFPPAFFEENPDPLPEQSVSGNPVSIQFNPLSYVSVDISSFRLFNHETGSEITNTLLLNSSSDPNNQLSGLQFALFPLERLDWNTAYRAEVEYASDNGSGTVRWAFRTRDPGFPILDYRQSGDLLMVPANYPDLVIYVPPEPDLDTLGGISYSIPAGSNIDTRFVDGNTLAISLDGASGQEFEFDLNDGRSFILRIGAAETLEEKQDISLSLDSVESDDDPLPTEQIFASFNGSNGTLTLPHVQVGASQQLGATLSLISSSPIRFRLANTFSVDSAAEAVTYTPADKTVTIPRVQVGASVYSVEMLLVSSDFVFEIQALEKLQL